MYLTQLDATVAPPMPKCLDYRIREWLVGCGEMFVNPCLSRNPMPEFIGA